MPPSRSRGKQGIGNTSPVVQRPRTRAFVKDHRLKIQDSAQEEVRVTNNRSRSRYPLRTSSRLGKKQPLQKSVTATSAKGQSQSRVLRSASKKDQEALTGPNILPKPLIRHSTRPASNRRSLSHNQHRQASQIKRIKGSGKETRISVWLSHSAGPFEPSEEPCQRSPSTQSSVAWEAEIMQSSSSVNTTESTTNEYDASTQTAGNKKARISYKQLLEFRGISVKDSFDEELERFGFHEITTGAMEHLKVDGIENLISVVEKHVKKLKASMKHSDSEDHYKLYEALKEDIDDWKPVDDAYRRFPAISSRHFKSDREHCMASSEADFQRTIMMSIIDRYDFGDLFTFSCEEQWTVEAEYLLPPRGLPNKIPQPKPDLAISFQRNTMTGADLLPYPINLSKCLSPGNKGDERWFPFLFIEAKKADHSLQHAQERNLHSASQALFNIYQWTRPYNDLTKKFFNEIRVFSIVLNAEDMQLRMHRAERDQKNQIAYKFTDVTRVRGYDRITACHLIKSVLLDYAALRLHPILKETFKRVAQTELKDGLAKKRKKPDIAEIQPGPVRAVSSGELAPLSPEPVSLQANDPSTGLSFDTADIELSGQPRKRGRPGARSGK